MIKTIKLKNILIAVGLIIASVLCSVGIVAVVESKGVPRPKYVIVIDAGHGGRDDGSIGTTGTKESEINLKIAKTLKVYLETLGIKVVLTRADDNGLYDANAKNFKVSDMEKRVEIIKKANPDMVISIHCNAFSDKSQVGAQAFFQESNEKSESFAEALQSQLLSQLPRARKSHSKGDYFLLKESPCSAVLVECGYLSNPEEEKDLCSVSYQNKVAYAIMCGVVKFFELCGND